MSSALASYPDDDDTAAAMERAESISYLPLDQDPIARAMPATIAEPYHYPEYDALAAEQAPLHAARGEQRARAHRVAAKRVEVQAEVDQLAIDEQKAVLSGAKQRWTKLEDTLGGLVRREAKAKWSYWLWWALIALGDVAGVSGAAIFLGEVPLLAGAQGVSIAVAALLSGMIGSDVKDARLARRRRVDPESLPADLQWRFTGEDSGEKIVKAMVAVSILIATVVCVGIFTLRYATEGTYAAWAFASMAVGICAASFINRYSYTDEVADLIDRGKADYTGELKRLRKLSKSAALATRNAETEQAESIITEHENLGVAGAHRLTSFKFGISRNNPTVFGHGSPARPPAVGLAAMAPFEQELRDDDQAGTR
ncbi:hypothetical protein ACXPWS_16305 [Mycobacterium sp. BMJ-28]